MQSSWFVVQSLNYITARHYQAANLVVHFVQFQNSSDVILVIGAVLLEMQK